MCFWAAATRCGPGGRASSAGRWQNWLGDGTCSHCGGIRPSIALEAITRGCEVTPTDKNYKIYVRMPNPEAGWIGVISATNWEPCPEGFVLADPKVLKASRWSDNWKWMMLAPQPELKVTKCYTNHFSEFQALEFVKLHHTGKMKLSYPGNFYSGLAFGRYKEAIQEMLSDLSGSSSHAQI